MVASPLSIRYPIPMRTNFIVLALSWLSATPALAQFEGVLEMKMHGGGAGPGGQKHEASGSHKIYVSPAGVRTEMEMSMGGMGGMRMVMLMLHKEPNVLYQINDAQKSYSVMDKATERSGKQSEY